MVRGVYAEQVFLSVCKRLRSSSAACRGVRTSPVVERMVRTDWHVVHTRLAAIQIESLLLSLASPCHHSIELRLQSSSGCRDYFAVALEVHQGTRILKSRRRCFLSIKVLLSDTCNCSCRNCDCGCGLICSGFQVLLDEKCRESLRDSPAHDAGVSATKAILNAFTSPRPNIRSMGSIVRSRRTSVREFLRLKPLPIFRIKPKVVQRWRAVGAGIAPPGPWLQELDSDRRLRGNDVALRHTLLYGEDRRLGSVPVRKRKDTAIVPSAIVIAVPAINQRRLTKR